MSDYWKPDPTVRYGPVRSIPFNPDVLREVLIYHQHTETSGCICGWAVLGASHADHVLAVYTAIYEAK